MNSAAHDERAEDAVEEHAVLAVLRDAEVLEDEHHDEDVVGAQRLFDDVAGQEGQSDVPPAAQMESQREQQRERHPYGRPDARFGGAYLVRPAMEHAEVEREHREHERNEPDPEPDVDAEHV